MLLAGSSSYCLSILPLGTAGRAFTQTLRFFTHSPTREAASLSHARATGGQALTSHALTAQQKGQSHNGDREEGEDAPGVPGWGVGFPEHRTAETRMKGVRPCSHLRRQTWGQHVVQWAQQSLLASLPCEQRFEFWLLWFRASSLGRQKMA